MRGWGVDGDNFMGVQGDGDELLSPCQFTSHTSI